MLLVHGHVGEAGKHTSPYLEELGGRLGEGGLGETKSREDGGSVGRGDL